MSGERYTVEKTAGVVQCDCPPWLCPHPDGFRDVSEWVVVDAETGDQGELHDLRRDAEAEAYRKNAST